MQNKQDTNKFLTLMTESSIVNTSTQAQVQSMSISAALNINQHQHIEKPQTVFSTWIRFSLSIYRQSYGFIFVNATLVEDGWGG